MVLREAADNFPAQVAVQAFGNSETARRMQEIATGTCDEKEVVEDGSKATSTSVGGVAWGLHHAGNA